MTRDNYLRTRAILPWESAYSEETRSRERRNIDGNHRASLFGPKWYLYFIIFGLTCNLGTILNQFTSSFQMDPQQLCLLLYCARILRLMGLSIILRRRLKTSLLAVSILHMIKALCMLPHFNDCFKFGSGGTKQLIYG